MNLTQHSRRRVAPILACGVVLLFVGQFVSCANHSPQTPSLGNEVSGIADHQAMAIALARTAGCFECHGVNKPVVGPAFRDVAARYRDDAGARDALIRTVKLGGKGNWAEVSRGVPMPPHQRQLSDAEVAHLIDWILERPPDAIALSVSVLAQRSGCFECHAAESRAIGPSFRAIAARYRGDPDAREALIRTVKIGGKGNWSDESQDIPMPPHHRRLSNAEVTQLVGWILEH